MSKLILIILFFAVFYCELISDDEYEDYKPQKPENVMRELDENPTINTILNRKSVRHFTSRTVSKDTLLKIVKAGMAAPTAVNMQPWSFVIVTEREILDKLANELPYAKMLFSAPSAIIVCALPESAFHEKPLEYSIIDCSAATENILLACEAMGLGAVWTAVYPQEPRIKTVRTILNIPEKIIPLNVIPIGYPTGEDLPKDKWKPEKIKWQKWE